MELIQVPVHGTAFAYVSETVELCFSRSVVQQHVSSPVYVGKVGSISVMPTIRSTKIPNERSGKMSSSLIQTRHEVDTKKELSRILRTDAAVKGIERKANSEKYITLWPKAVLEALDEAIKENRWQSALKIFHLLRKQHWYEPRCKTFIKLFKVLGSCKQPDQASLLFEVMLSEGLKPTIDVYTSLIAVYGKSGLLDKAFATLEYMKSVSDCKPDVFTFTVLISCCCKLGRFDLVKSIVLEMSYLGVGCSTVTYNTIIDGYGKAGMFVEMENVLAEMIEDGDSLPDVFTLNSIIGSYGNGGNVKKMENWYNRFQLMGVQPDITTFNILILSYGKAGMYKKMSSVMDFMEKRFFSLTTVTYNIVIETFGKAGKFEKMDNIFRKMKYQGVKPNSITYCSLVNAYSKAGLVGKIDSVLRQIVNSDVVLDTMFFNCIINAYGQAGDLATMKELYIQMEERKCKPDKVTFATMIKTYTAHGIFDAVQELEKQMISSTVKKEFGIGELFTLRGSFEGCRSCIESERQGLLELKAFYRPFDRDRVLREWKTTSHRSCCSWKRIKCNPISKRVIKISLGSLCYGTNLEPPQLNLTLLYPFEELQSLNMSLNCLGGWFDHNKGNLRRLRHLEILDIGKNFINNSILPYLNEVVSLKTLILDGNYIEGGFPAKELMNLTSLEVLNLKFNNISGHLPGQELNNFKNLKALDVSENQFSGSLQTQGICLLEQIQELRLSRNKLVGEIPICFSSFSKLRVLDLSWNNLSGKLPSFISSFKSIEYLSLHDNNFEGLFSLDLITELPELKVFKLSSRSNMLQVVESNVSSGLQSQLRSIVLPYCNLGNIPGFLRYQKELLLIDLSNNALSGVFPTWLLENNTKLQVLILQNNSLTTLTLPRFHKLQFLDVSTNKFSDQLPEDIGLILPRLRHLNLSNNEFQESLPSSVATMEGIEFMDLSYNNFSGKLPRNLFTGCYLLKWLKLSHNRFHGPIIQESSDITSLMTLIMDNNMFTGKITKNLRNLRLLTVIDLSNNFIEGTIPRWLGSFFLEVLRLSNNRLQGTIPPSLFKIPYLWLLDLSGNFFSGSLPRRYFNDYGYILDLHNNNLTGSIPDTLWEGLVLLDLRNNRFSGNIPRFKSTPGINVVLLRGNDLTGKIPLELCGLSNVRMLDLSHNRLNESIPSCLTNLSFGLGRNSRTDLDWYPANTYPNYMEIYTDVYYMSVLVLEQFGFEYPVDFNVQVEFAVKQRYDSYMRGTLEQMFGLDLSSNELVGKIPEELGNLKKVRSLNLSRNALSGFIPRSFSNLRSIESLDLSFNMLHGTIPLELTMMQSLVVFNVSYNDLSGLIPQGRQFSTFGEKSYLGNALLCGSPTNRSCGTTIGSGEEEKAEEDEDGFVDMMVLWWSLSATYVTVLVGFLVFLCFDSPWRRVWFYLVDAFIDRVKDVFGVI